MTRCGRDCNEETHRCLYLTVTQDGRAYHAETALEDRSLDALLAVEVDDYARELRACGRTGFERTQSGFDSKLKLFIRSDRRAAWSDVLHVVHLAGRRRVHRVGFVLTERDNPRWPYRMCFERASPDCKPIVRVRIFRSADGRLRFQAGNQTVSDVALLELPDAEDCRNARIDPDPEVPFGAIIEAWEILEAAHLTPTLSLEP